MFKVHFIHVAVVIAFGVSAALMMHELYSTVVHALSFQ